MDCGGKGRVTTDIATYECSIYRVENEHDVVIEPRLQLHEMNKALVPNIIPPFPPKRVSEFAAMELNLFADSWRGMLGEMGGPFTSAA